jgi:hypothetical protein
MLSLSNLNSLKYVTLPQFRGLKFRLNSCILLHLYQTGSCDTALRFDLIPCRALSKRLPLLLMPESRNLQHNCISLDKPIKSTLHPQILCSSSGQSSWLQIQRSGFDSRCYQIFWEVVGLERSPLSLVSTIEELLGRNSIGSDLKIREYDRRDHADHVAPSIREN